jgi:hypothetical protein
MTRVGRRLVVLCAVLGVAASVSGCKVLQRAESTAGPSTTAAANAVEASSAGSARDCPLDAAAVASALGGRWRVASLPSGGCNYTSGGRTILISTVPLPRDAAGRIAALARVRRPCDATSTESLPAGAFVCQQDSLVEAAAISGDHLLVLCTAAGTGAGQVAGIQSQLRTLVTRLG